MADQRMTPDERVLYEQHRAAVAASEERMIQWRAGVVAFMTPAVRARMLALDVHEEDYDPAGERPKSPARVAALARVRAELEAANVGPVHSPMVWHTRLAIIESRRRG